MKTAIVSALFVTSALAHMGEHHKRAHMPAKQNWIKRRASSMRRQLGQAALLALSDDTTQPAAPTMYTGTALWFNQTGAISACHTYPSNEDMIIGLPMSLYNATGTPSPLCGQTVVVTALDTGKNATLAVADASGNDYVTLSIAAFRAIGPNLRIGELNIQYYFANDASPAAAALPLGSGLPVSGSGSIVPAAAQPTLTVVAATQAAQNVTSVLSKAQPTTPPSDAAAQSAAAQASAAAAAAAQAQAQSAQSVASVQAAKQQQAQQAQASQAAEQQAEAAASSKSAAAAAAAASQQAQQEAAAAAAAAASSSSSAAAAAASKKAQQAQQAQEAADAAAAASSSSAAAAAASAKAKQQQQQQQQQQDQQNNSNNGNGNGNGNGGGSWVTGGFATFFYQNGVAGACGKVNSDSALIVAQDSRMYNGGANCGKQVQIIRTDTGASVTATIADECPTCDNAQCLDLSVGAFKAIASEDEGEVPIKYEYV